MTRPSPATHHPLPPPRAEVLENIKNSLSKAEGALL